MNVQRAINRIGIARPKLRVTSLLLRKTGMRIAKKGVIQESRCMTRKTVTKRFTIIPSYPYQYVVEKRTSMLRLDSTFCLLDAQSCINLPSGNGIIASEEVMHVND